MSDTEAEPLDAELRELFAVEARYPEQPLARRTRVWSGLESALALPPAPSAVEDAPLSPLTAAAGSAGLGKLAAVALSAFVFGGAAGAGVYHTLVERPAPVVIEVPVPPPLPVVTPLDAPDAGGEPPARDAGETARARREPREPRAAKPAIVDEPTGASALSQERALIDVVRTAIARGHADSALEAIDRHARLFPRGRLVEEREGLRVLALLRAGRVSEAETQAARFGQRYPGSLLWPAIKASLESAR
jgi:hypothetical protein